MAKLDALAMVCTCTETGSQTVQYRDRWDYTGAVRWANQCRPQEVRQVYLGGRELTRRERFQPEIIDAHCEESALVRECRAIVAAGEFAAILEGSR